MQTSIVLLAAGASSRMGTPKQLLPIGSKNMIQTLIDEALKTSCYPITVVLGANKAKIVPALVDMPINLVDNANWESGMASSIKMGLIGSYMIEKNIDSILFLTSDMPYVTSGYIQEIIRKAEETEALIIASKYGGTVGIPALFKREIFTDLLELTGEEGARKLIQQNKEKLALVDFPNGAFDLDTPEDYASFIRRN
ncbi:MAG: NTP transferase domain-containing protein [Spirosomataceae bacterium]